MKLASAFLIGLVFGLGIAISGMGNPAKVLNFFDPAGTFDPSLLLVMAGALATTATGYRLSWRLRAAPVFEPAYDIPKSRVIDAKLVGGSTLFGIGWGITGFCPGGAIPMIGAFEQETLLFIAAMMAGIVLARAMQAARLKPVAA